MKNITIITSTRAEYGLLRPVIQKVAAAFMALIVRVIKNAFAQAVKMKDELDYTV